MDKVAQKQGQQFPLPLPRECLCSRYIKVPATFENIHKQNFIPRSFRSNLSYKHGTGNEDARDWTALTLLSGQTNVNREQVATNREPFGIFLMFSTQRCIFTSFAVCRMLIVPLTKARRELGAASLLVRSRLPP